MTGRSPSRIVAEVMREHGRTYAAAAGIRLRDKPSSLFQLLVLTQLSSTRISADIATAAARELFRAGWRTPQKLRDATWQQRVDALGRGGYRRYDESTATKLEEASHWLQDTHGGDLRRLRPRTHADVHALRDAIAETPRIGPVGPTSSAARCRPCGPRSRPSSTARPWTELGHSGCRPTRTAWPTWLRVAGSPCWPLRSPAALWPPDKAAGPGTGPDPHGTTGRCAARPRSMSRTAYAVTCAGRRLEASRRAPRRGPGRPRDPRLSARRSHAPSGWRATRSAPEVNAARSSRRYRAITRPTA